MSEPRHHRGILGLDRPTMARWHSNLGSMLWQLGHLAGARAQYERTLTIDEAVLGADHPRPATDRSNIDRVVRGPGDQSANV